MVLDAFSMKVLHFCSSPKPWDPDAKKGDLEQTLERWLGTSIVCCIWLTVSSFRTECCRLTRLCDYLLCLEGLTFFCQDNWRGSVQFMKASSTSVTDSNKFYSIFPWACHYINQSDVLHVSQEAFLVILEWATYSWPKWPISWANLVIEDITWNFSPCQDPESPPPLPSTQDLVGALFEVAGAFLEKLCARYLRYLWWIAALFVWQKMLAFVAVCCIVEVRLFC